jgi:hypothetical protein
MHFTVQLPLESLKEILGGWAREALSGDLLEPIRITFPRGDEEFPGYVTIFVEEVPDADSR